MAATCPQAGFVKIRPRAVKGPADKFSLKIDEQIRTELDLSSAKPPVFEIEVYCPKTQKVAICVH
jgi:hypothetical protein